MDHDRLRGAAGADHGHGDVHSVSSGGRAHIVHLSPRWAGRRGVDTEAFVDAIAASGLFPQLSGQEWRDVMIEAYVSGAYT